MGSARWWLHDQRDRLTDWAEMLWLCKVRRRHHVKMDSHGRCYRCWRLIER